MPRRLVNLLLLALSVLLAASGLLGWLVPGAAANTWYDLHRLLGVTLLLALVWKVPIARGSLARRLTRPRLRSSVVPGLLAGVAALGALGLGLAWTLDLIGLDSFGGYSPLNVHVQAGLLLLPLLTWHLTRRWERKPPLTSLVRRRVLAQLVGVGGAAIVGWQTIEVLAAAAVPVGTRRTSGSKHAGSFTGNALPETIWLFDGVPTIDAAAWTLQIVAPEQGITTLSILDLADLPRVTMDAVLDCTGGWWSEQRWSGWHVGDILALAGVDPRADGTATVASASGHYWTFSLFALRSMLLATHLGDEPLSPGHGAPVRLVAPDRRGVQWVKWVTRIELLSQEGSPA